VLKTGVCFFGGGNPLLVTITPSNTSKVFSLPGNGIDKETIPICLRNLQKSFQGTGLGPYISKRIIESHGGKIWAQDNKDGKGATFSYSLPLT
jgi:signal transduction histidine kinase